MDVLHKSLNFIDHERWKVLGFLLAIIMVIGFIGCEPNMPSLQASEKKVTQEVFELEAISMERSLADKLVKYEALGKNLDAEVIEYNAKVEFGRAGFERKIEFRRKFIDLAGGAAIALITGQPLEAASVASSFLALMGIGVGVGAVIDSKRKDRVMKENKLIVKNTT